jgi:hypothetical protein
VPHDQSAHSSGDQRLIDVLPESFWVAGALGGVGGAAGLGFVIDFKAAMEEVHDLAPSEDLKLIESVGKDERWYEKVEDSFHVHVETLTPTAFLRGTQQFLQSVGLVALTQISVDEQAIGKPDGSKLDLNQAVDACSDYLNKNAESVRTIEITSHGKNDEFTLLVDFSYRRKHRPMNPPIELVVQAMSNELGPKEGESFAEYRTRMNALDTSLQQTEREYAKIEAQKQAMHSDYAHHLGEAFPGIKLQFYERLAPGEA